MGFEDILAVAGVLLGIVFPIFTKFDDKANQILNSLLLTKTSILAEFIEKIENKIHNNLVYDDSMSTSFSLFIKQMSVAFENKINLKKHINKYAKYTSRLIVSAILIFGTAAIKNAWLLCSKYGKVFAQEKYLDIFNGLIIIIFLYLLYCICRIWGTYMGFRHLSTEIKRQADFII